MKKLIASAIVAAAIALPAVPAAADDVAAPAGVTFCGATGHYIVWYYDLQGRYRELINTCI